MLAVVEFLIWYFLPFWYAWAFGLFLGLAWTYSMLWVFNDNEQIQRTRGLYAGMFGILNMPAVFLSPEGPTFSVGGFMSFLGVMTVGFSVFYQANFKDTVDREAEEEQEEEEKKEWKDKKW
jgi:hypothetical protein